MKHHVKYIEMGGHIFEPLYKDHLSVMANLERSLRWLLYTGLTVYSNRFIIMKINNILDDNFLL